MNITNQSHPYRLCLGDKIIAFPAAMSHAEIRAACRKIAGKSRPIRPSNALSNHELTPTTILKTGAKIADQLKADLAGKSSADLQNVRSATLDAIRAKAMGDPTKARKLFYALGDTARVLFGDHWADHKKAFDRASKEHYLSKSG
jgi:hypothetical protein